MTQTGHYRLREVRKTRGLTQQQLADQIGSPQCTVARLEGEKHEPSLRVALGIARALDSTVEVLFGEAITTST
jgi:DNA-binding XRE family transcriptional regulator